MSTLAVVSTDADSAPRAFATWAACPLVPLAVAFAVGIAASAWVPGWAAWVTWAVAVTAVVLALTAPPLVGDGIAGTGGVGRVGVVGAGIVGAGGILVAIAALGMLRAAPPPLAPDHIARLALPVQAEVVGRLVVSAAPVPGRMRVLVDVDHVDGERRSGRVQLTAYGERAGDALTTGQRIRVPARLQPPTGFRNPGGFDHVARLARDGIHVTGSARAHEIVVLDTPPLPWNERVRRHAIRAIDAALPPASAALLAGLLLGERRALPPEIDEGFRRAGVYHVLAVSGFNVALIASAVFLLARLMGLGRRAAAGSAAGVVLGFGAVVGPQASVLRAVVMAMLVLAAVLLDRDSAVVNSLAAAALLILAVRPNDLFEPGFQLSFAATGGIVLAPRPRRMVLAALAVSAAAQVAVLPITLWHFHQVSVVGLVANLAAVPLAAVATVIGLAGAALAFVWDTAAALAFDAVWPALLALRFVVALAAALPGGLVYLPSPPPAAIACYAGALVVTAVAWRVRRPRARVAHAMLGGAGLALVAAIALAAWPLVRPADGRLRIAILDVGQGDALVIEGPNGEAVVVDAGPGGRGRLDAGERVVAPYLWWRGFLRVAGTVVTHAHADHAGGMDAVRARFPGAPAWTAADLATPRALGGALITALPPITGATPNERALVLRVEYRTTSFLLASDIPGAVEQALVTRGTPLGATVLKVAHHGARDSSSGPFLDAVRPAVAAISVGARNAYRHPDAGTLARLDAAGARVLRTDRDGALLFETDGRVLTVTAWASGRQERWCVDPEAPC